MKPFWEIKRERIYSRRYHVYRLCGQEERDCGIWRGYDVASHLTGPEDEEDLYNLPIKQSLTLLLGDMDGSDTYRIVRVKKTTPIVDDRSWFDKLLHFVFRIKHEYYKD